MEEVGEVTGEVATGEETPTLLQEVPEVAARTLQGEPTVAPSTLTSLPDSVICARLTGPLGKELHTAGSQGHAPGRTTPLIEILASLTRSNQMLK